MPAVIVAMSMSSFSLTGPARPVDPRTVTDLHAAIQRAFAHFTPQECRNYIAADGYEEDLTVST